MSKEIRDYNAALSSGEKKISNALMKEISSNLPGAESKIWHRHPVWFLDGNPVAGYSKAQKIQWDYKNIVKRKGKLVRLK